jgi:hypothetical protein
LDSAMTDIIRTTDFRATPMILAIGDTATLSLTLVNEGLVTADIRLDFALISPTPSGRTSRKVFRWTDATLAPGKSMDFQTSHSFIPRTIRKVHPGTHGFEVICNGVVQHACTVEVETA